MLPPSPSAALPLFLTETGFTNPDTAPPGELHIGKLASTHGLTVADMEAALASRLGVFVHGRVERQVLFTTAFIQKQTATIAGALTATTRPTSTLDIIQRFKLQPELFEATLKQVRLQRSDAARSHEQHTMRARYWVRGGAV